MILTLPGDAVNKGDYSIDGQVFAVRLLNRLQDITVYPALPPTPITFTVTVQPWLPADSEGLRVRTEPKTLQSKVTVNLQYNATGVNALPNVAQVNLSKPASIATASHPTSRDVLHAALDGLQLNEARRSKDPALIRTAQLPPLPPFLNAPQPPPALNTPALLAPNVASEAEQVSKLLTGQPVATTISIPPPSLSPSQASAQAAAASLAATATAATQAAIATVPPIVVTPSPVMVVSPPPTTAKKKPQSRIHKMLNRMGNRMSQAVPQ